MSIPLCNSNSNLIIASYKRVFTALVTVLHLLQTFNIKSSDVTYMMKLTKYYDLNYSRKSHFISADK